ncbi:polymorphic toxin type 33 domain-containing protein [Belliella marina]|uniref:Polymorphic toxin type 33 domain-containing protein n=1 Tax=Belliella marina TaxID=1644146 RepID=A0ABW4VK89_9BACT
MKGGKRTGQTYLYKYPAGDIFVKGKGGKGPGEPTGININDLK